MDISAIVDPKDESAAEIASLALGLIPGVGGMMSSVAMFYLDKTRNQRLNSFLIQLSQDLDKIKDHLNQDFIHKEQFRDLVEDVFTKASYTHQQEKLDALRAIFLNSITSPHPQYEEIEEITNLIQSWQPSHIILLKILTNPKDFNESKGNPIKSQPGGIISIIDLLRLLLPEWDDYRLKRSWQTLFDDHIHTTESIGGAITNKGIDQLDNRLTDFGKKVARYLTNPIS